MDNEVKVKINLEEVAPQISDEICEIRRLSDELYHVARSLYMKLGYDLEVIAKPLDTEKK
nr:MAG TPA: hypothetical protein [Caudoviricetes sp.]